MDIHYLFTTPTIGNDTNTKTKTNTITITNTNTNMNDTSMSVTISEAEAFSILELACWKGHVDHVRSVAAEIDLHAFFANGYDANNSGATLLMFAMQAGNAVCAKILLAYGANANAEDCWRRTPLSIAAAFGHDSCVKLLLKHRARVEGSGVASGSPLLLAVTGRHYKCVSALLRHGADANLVDSCGSTMLMTAIDRSNAKYLTAFLKHGANPNSLDQRHNRALYRAAQKVNRLLYTKILLAHGADVHCGDKENPYLLRTAVGCKDMQYLTLLLDAGANVNSGEAQGSGCLLYALETWWEKGARLLTLRGANPQAKSAYGTPVLIRAVQASEKKDLPGLLLAKGAKIEQKCSRGDTALVHAARLGNLEQVRLLLRRGANVYVRDKYGKYPLIQMSREEEEDEGEWAEIAEELRLSILRQRMRRFRGLVRFLIVMTRYREDFYRERYPSLGAVSFATKNFKLHVQIPPRKDTRVDNHKSYQAGDLRKLFKFDDQSQVEPADWLRKKPCTSTCSPHFDVMS